MSPLVSIIVPVYNSALYIKDCIESVLIQTFKDFELIIVDDGSEDDSPVICQQYANKDNRIRIIRKSNGGVSTARNVGIDSSDGEWIMFLDADDYWITPTALEQLVNLSRNSNLDIVRGEYISVNENKQPIFPKDYTYKIPYINKRLTPSEFLKNVIRGEFFLVLCLIRKKTLGNIRFDTQQIFLEDMKLLMKLLSGPVTCGYKPCSFYAYRKIESSASNKSNVKKLSDAFEMIPFFKEISNSCTDMALKEFCNHYAIMMYCWTLQTISESPYYTKKKSIISQLKLNKLQKDIKKYRKKTNTKIEIKYQMIIHLKPLTGIIIFRLKAWIKKIVTPQ